MLQQLISFFNSHSDSLFDIRIKDSSPRKPAAIKSEMLITWKEFTTTLDFLELL